MKTLKKILALAIVAMMAMGMMSALADDALPAAGGPATTTGSPQTTVLDIDKAFVVKNDVGGIQVQYPEVVYTFSVAPKTIAADDANAYVQNGNAKVAVQTGYANAIGFGTTAAALGVNTATLTFASSKVRLNANGEQAVTKPLNIYFDAPAHKSPGIYRYLLTDTTPDTNLTSKYVVRGEDIEKEYNLDVYIGYADDDNDGNLDDKNNDGKIDENDLVIGGYVLTEDDDQPGETPITPDVVKASGIDDLPELEPRDPSTPADPTDPTSPTDPDNDPTDPQDDKKIKNDQQLTADQLKGNDVYYTYNVEVKKVVTGTAGDTLHEFPFALAVTNNDLDYVVSETDGESTDLSNKLAAVTMNNNDVTKIQGLAPNATVKYTETNDTPSQYTVGVTAGSTKLTLTGGSMAVEADKTRFANNGDAIAMESALNVAQGYALTTPATKIDDNADVTFTNKLDSISPTGLVLRFAPYLAMLGAGLLIVLVARRKKSENED